jgi:plastocyanin
MISVFLIGAVGCKDRTEVVIGVATDLRARNQIDLVKFLASRNGAPIIEHEWPLSDVPLGLYELPGSFGLFTDDGSEPRVELDIQAFHGKDLVVDRQSILSLVSGQTLFVRMALTSDCSALNGPTCKSDETCIEGVCQPRTFDAHHFPKYRPELVRSIECAGGPQYIVSSTGNPMPMLGAGCQGSDWCQEGTCYKRLPTDALADLAMPAQLGDAAPSTPVCDGGVDASDDAANAQFGNTDMRVNVPIAVGLPLCLGHFVPSNILISLGTTLQFQAGGDGQSHHITGAGSTSGDVKSGNQFFTFNTAGTFEFTCVDHPGQGVLVVHVQ